MTFENGDCQIIGMQEKSRSFKPISYSKCNFLLNGKKYTLQLVRFRKIFLLFIINMRKMINKYFNQNLNFISISIQCKCKNAICRCKKCEYIKKKEKKNVNCV